MKKLLSKIKLIQELLKDLYELRRLNNIESPEQIFSVDYDHQRLLYLLNFLGIKLNLSSPIDEETITNILNCLKEDFYKFDIMWIMMVCVSNIYANKIITFANEANGNINIDYFDNLKCKGDYNSYEQLFYEFIESLGKEISDLYYDLLKNNHIQYIKTISGGKHIKTFVNNKKVILLRKRLSPSVNFLILSHELGHAWDSKIRNKDVFSFYIGDLFREFPSELFSAMFIKFLENHFPNDAKELKDEELGRFFYLSLQINIIYEIIINRNTLVNDTIDTLVKETNKHFESNYPEIAKKAESFEKSSLYYFLGMLLSNELIWQYDDFSTILEIAKKFLRTTTFKDKKTILKENNLMSFELPSLEEAFKRARTN
ncbi:MAG: hypothetical protein GX951_04335 [Mollicutes bacterium]|nr:hypothetical protein [Mollicutes bacterium]